MMFIQSILAAFYKVGVTKRQPTPVELDQLCSASLSKFDNNVDSKLSLVSPLYLRRRIIRLTHTHLRLRSVACQLRFVASNSSSSLYV